MITSTLTCTHCASAAVIRYGKTRNGNPRYRCRECKRTFCLNPNVRTVSPEKKAQILAACHERCSLRGVARIFGVSRNTIADWLKKSEPLAVTGNDPVDGAI